MEEQKTIRHLSFEEFMEEGTELFGSKNWIDWWFKCPICGHSQQASEMIKKYPEKRQYIIDSVYFSCEGRLDPLGKSAFHDKPEADHGCDYTLGGLFNFGEKYVTPLTGGKPIPVFEFDESKGQQ